MIKGQTLLEIDGSGEDDGTQDEDWVQLEVSTAGINFDTYMSIDQELATYGVLCVWKKCVVSWKVEVARRRARRWW
jgi:hypothetical protein